MQSSGSRISQDYVKVPEHARSAAFRRFFEPFLLPNKMNRIVTISDVDVALELVICLSGGLCKCLCGKAKRKYENFS